MKKIILILITAFCVVNGFAQQFPLQSQYQFNYSSMNPAAVGEFDYLKMVASYRNQWSGFNTQHDQAIATQYVTFTQGFGTNGLGLSLLNDNTGGAFNTTGFRLSYSHKIIYDTHKLFLGLSGGGTKLNMNASNFNDAAVVTNSDFLPEATFGAYVLVKDWKLGFSVPGMLNENMELTASSENQITSHFYSMISYTKKLNDDWSLYPSILLKSTEDHQQLDANLNVKLKNKIWFGASYRTSPDEGANEAFGPSFYLGVDLGRLFALYSHDISSGNMSSYPTHEITIGYDFRPLTQEELDKRKNKEEEERIEDMDNDGVVDSLDLCPNLAGSVKANGCPDFDKDGIPDKYDLCPAIPGSFEAGCPDLTEMEKRTLQNVLNNLEFNAGSDRLSRSSYSSLSQLAVLLIQNQAMFLEIHGYASSEGESSYNLGLSARRAKSVEEFFLSKGVNINSLITRFSGEASPIASNASETGRSKNRRAELSIRFHLKDQKQVIATENAYSQALEGINQSNDNDYTYNQDNYRSEKTEVIQYEDEVFEEEIAVPEQNLNNTLDNIDNEEEVIEDDIDIENVNYDEIIDLSTPQYLLVVQTFVSKENAIKYIDKSSEDLNYKQVGNRYYVYVFSSVDRDDVVRFRSLYKDECWIKAP
jgi:type IX secretion system PorP/SprF family membrane protein